MWKTLWHNVSALNYVFYYSEEGLMLKTSAF